MTERESFLDRWSRLKRQEAERPPPEAEAAPPAPVPEEPEPTQEPVDPATLPPLDTLGADSDYTPFLAPGVPEELRRLALRKAWSSDPAIAGFRGFAEYDWDYNAPGYGQLLPVDDIKRLCDAVFGETDKEPPPEPERPPERPAEEIPTAEAEPEDGEPPETA
ncbi:MAG TPA: DUF3306 domain-containing protein [Azospirillum sp.]|nr:DUF3306 domain-containing protein [Azospirillum sp.]